MNLYFVRHGESEANTLHVFSNRGLKHGLTEKGRQQAETLAEKLKDIKFDAIYTSPLLRAIETSEVISKRLGLNYTISNELTEFDVGVFEDKSNDESWNRFCDLLDDWLIRKNWDSKIEEGESFNDIKARFLPFINNLKVIHHENSNILLIGHGGTFKCIFPLILSNVDFEHSNNNLLKNTEYVLARLDEEKLHCVRWGERVFSV